MIYRFPGDGGRFKECPCTRQTEGVSSPADGTVGSFTPHAYLLKNCIYKILKEEQVGYYKCVIKDKGDIFRQ
jgi:hypothetical protein